MLPKVILWDVGGVIQPDDRMPAQVLGISQTRYKALGRTRAYQQYMLGNITEDELAESVVAFLKWPKSRIEKAKEAIRSNWEAPREEVVAIIRELTGRYRQMILSNSMPCLEEKVRQAHREEYSASQRYLQYFADHDIIFSHRIHAKKPSPESFAAVQHVCKVQPKYWLYIDDRISNLRAAEKYGVGATILFTTALRKKLVAQGIL